MTRVKRGKTANKRRKNLREHTKGFRSGRNSKITRVREATMHAFLYMFAHRRKKKGDFRTLWNVKIGSASRPLGIKYSQLIAALKKANVKLDRKILAELAENEPKIFAKVVEKVK